MELPPFAAMQNVALRIYSGSLTSQEMCKTIYDFWLIILIILGSMLCKYAEKITII